MNLELSLKQTLKLTPQMLQSMEVLQMSTQELADYIQDLVQMNPAAELTEPAAQSTPPHPPAGAQPRLHPGAACGPVSVCLPG